MQRRLLTLLVLVLAATSLLIPATAGANNGAEVTITKGQTVMARFFSDDTTTCIRPTIFVGAGEQVVKSNQTDTVTERGLSAIVFVFDACEGTMRRYNGSVDNATVEIAKNLDHARLIESFEAVEFATGESIHVELDLTWTPTDMARKDQFTDSYTMPSDDGSFEVIVHQTGADTWRPAIASGTVTIGEITRVMTTENLATFHDFRNGNVTIVH